MSDPTKANKVNPHLVSSNRTPGEIAKDEAAPAASPRPADAGPMGPELTPEDKERRAAVQRSAHRPEK